MGVQYADMGLSVLECPSRVVYFMYIVSIIDKLHRLRYNRLHD